MTTLVCNHCAQPYEAPSGQELLRRFCSSSCSALATVARGIEHPNYNGGLTFNKSLGRWFIVCRDGTTVAYYRAVMAAHIGRPLRTDELVHHRNGDPTDDRIENLEITTRSEHMRMHMPEIVAGRL